MSEAATERPASAPNRAGGGNILQRKFGPLPGWGWAALAGVAAAGYLWYRNRQGGSAAADSASADSAATGAVGDDVQGQLSTIQTEIQGLQGAESAEGSTTPANSGSGTGQKVTFRHVSTGKETLNQIAKARNTSVAHIVAASTAGPESKDNLAKLVAWAKHPGTRRKGIVYYTSSGPAEGA
jgi:hypothetical protein